MTLVSFLPGPTATGCPVLRLMDVSEQPVRTPSGLMTLQLETESSCWRQGLINGGLTLDFLSIAHLNIEQPLRITLANVLFLFDLARKKEDSKGDEVMLGGWDHTHHSAPSEGFRKLGEGAAPRTAISFSSWYSRAPLPRRQSLQLPG